MLAFLRSRLAFRLVLPLFALSLASALGAALLAPGFVDRDRAWVVLAALLALAASFALAARVARPLARLEAAAKRLAAGDFTARAGLRRGDEFGRLGAAFDRMATELGALDQAKSEFVASVGRELRAPLAALRLSVAGMIDGAAGGTPSATRAALERVQGELERLIRLVGLLLEMARLDAGEVTVERERIELRPLAEEVFGMLAPLAGEHGVALALEGAGTVTADRGMVERILLNLLDDAIRLSPEGSRVLLALSPRGFRLRDQGPGIQTSFIFEPFRERRPFGAENPGVNLGPAIVRKLVELNRGSVRLEPGPGAGLVVELPGA
jgi:signal transduction histidine kinase